MQITLSEAVARVEAETEMAAEADAAAEEAAVTAAGVATVVERKRRKGTGASTH